MTSQGAPPRTILVLLLAVTLGPAIGLIVLGWQLIVQDRALAAQRLAELREQVADRALTSLSQTLATVSQRLAEVQLKPGEGALLASIAEGRVSSVSGDPLLFDEHPTSLPEAAREPFSQGEIAEFQSSRLSQAADNYRGLTKHPNSAIRAAAWMRLARVLRKSSDHDAALRAYREASTFKDLTFAGVPVDLAARAATCALLSAANQKKELGTQASSLAADLYAGKWRLDRAKYESYAAEVSKWCNCPRPLERESLALAALKLTALPHDSRSSGHDLIDSVTILWHRDADRIHALIATQAYTTREWIDPVSKKLGAKIWIRQQAGKQNAVYRAAAATGLPWPVAVAVTSPDTILDSLTGRRNLLLAGLALIIVLAAAGSYLVARSVSRELAVARLQSDFVAAVSHEFRTPLTALSQVAETLTDNRIPEARRTAYYATMARATSRLQRLVEQLLDFGRMEAGATPYRLQPIDASTLANSVAREFQQEVEPRGFTLHYTPTQPLPILADAEALSTALWNLLDNAAKYSGDSRNIKLEVTPDSEAIQLKVTDYGLGIEPAEQQTIFQKFVRGEYSKSSGIKGTGIGLAMVTHIVAGHNGRILLSSSPGRGSTFSIQLPKRTERTEPS